jgi:hypothetical protein
MYLGRYVQESVYGKDPATVMSKEYHLNQCCRGWGNLRFYISNYLTIYSIFMVFMTKKYKLKNISKIVMNI